MRWNLELRRYHEKKGDYRDCSYNQPLNDNQYQIDNHYHVNKRLHQGKFSDQWKFFATTRLLQQGFDTVEQALRFGHRGKTTDPLAVSGEQKLGEIPLDALATEQAWSLAL